MSNLIDTAWKILDLSLCYDCEMSENLGYESGDFLCHEKENRLIDDNVNPAKTPLENCCPLVKYNKIEDY